MCAYGLTWHFNADGCARPLRGTHRAGIPRVGPPVSRSPSHKMALLAGAGGRARARAFQWTGMYVRSYGTSLWAAAPGRAGTPAAAPAAWA